MKPSSDRKILAQKLIEMGLEKNFALISKCGTKEEYISYDIRDLQLEKVPYMSIVIIKKEGLI
jgi:precorrin-2/cobalt-factor-2 C20-methyltransferase